MKIIDSIKDIVYGTEYMTFQELQMNINDKDHKNSLGILPEDRFM